MRLWIKVDGQECDLKPDMSFNVTIESQMMGEDGAIPIPFTSPIELPVTPKNLKIFGYPNLSNASTNRFIVHNCEIGFGFLPLFAGELELESSEDMLKGALSGALMLADLKKPMNTIELPSIDCSGALYEDPVVYINKQRGPDDVKLRNNYQALDEFLRNNLNSLSSKYVISPIRLLANKWDSTKNGWRFGSLRTMFINTFWMNEQGYSPSSLAVVGNLQPAVKLGYMLDQIFGGELPGNFLKTGKYSRLIIQPLYHPELKEGEVGYPYFVKKGNRRYFELRNCFPPEVSKIDFVKEILKIFCMTLFVENGKFILKQNRDIMNDMSYVDLTDYYIRTISVSTQKGKFYKYGYSDFENEEPKATNGMGSFFSMYRDDGTADIWGDELRVIVGKLNQTVLRHRDEGHTQRWMYENMNSGFGGSKKDDYDDRDTFDMSSKVCPLLNSIHNLWSVDGTPTEWPARSAYIYDSVFIPETRDIGDDKSYPKIMIYHGTQTNFNAPDKTIPFISAKAYDGRGANTPPTNFTLDWDGDYGLFKTLHAEFAQWVSKDKRTLQIETKGDPVVISKFKAYRKVYVEGKLYYIHNVNFDVFLDHISPVVLDLIDI